ncbi:MAG: ribonuclease III [Eubacteriaceae bacterium]|nr:ribonuclease III [Eubacteriaceae bacterium]
MRIEKFEKLINYRFTDKEIIKNALTHSSFINEKFNFRNNERIEFLGDAVLELVISNYLYNTYTELTEGELTKLRAKIVCTESLSSAAQKNEMGMFIFMGKGEENTGGRNRKSILANTFEAVAGAIYLDGGFVEANRFILSMLKSNIEDAVSGKMVFDYKTKLQEVIQKRAENNIRYMVTNETGPEHNKLFYVDLILNGKIIGTGTGYNKKEAEQNAAYDGLLELGVLNE